MGGTGQFLSSSVRLCRIFLIDGLGTWVYYSKLLHPVVLDHKSDCKITYQQKSLYTLQKPVI